MIKNIYDWLANITGSSKRKVDFIWLDLNNHYHHQRSSLILVSCVSQCKSCSLVDFPNGVKTSEHSRLYAFIGHFFFNDIQAGYK